MKEAKIQNGRPKVSIDYRTYKRGECVSSGSRNVIISCDECTGPHSDFCYSINIRIATMVDTVSAI